jgi:hypothetical protein
MPHAHCNIMARTLGSSPGETQSERPVVPPEFRPVGENRLADSGPRYTETPADPYSPEASFPAEPWNTATASLFIVLAIYWIVRLRGRFDRFPFLAAALPILLVGGIGGTLYHAFRTRSLYFFLDLIPILVLGLAAALYLSGKLVRWYGWRSVAFTALGVIAGFLVVNSLVFRVAAFENRNIPVNVSYGTQAVLILVPLIGVLIRTQFRNVSFVAAGLVSFGIAWFCRLIDSTGLDVMPMGTHWLWHLFGVLCTAFLIEYFYRLEEMSRASENAA